jgi:hypothetical protein
MQGFFCAANPSVTSDNPWSKSAAEKSFDHSLSVALN